MPMAWLSTPPPDTALPCFSHSQNTQGPEVPALSLGPEAQAGRILLVTTVDGRLNEKGPAGSLHCFPLWGWQLHDLMSILAAPLLSRLFRLAVAWKAESEDRLVPRLQASPPLLAWFLE